MHKPFYASGFLYHIPSQQILLQQLNSDDPKLVLFGAISHNGTKPHIVFQNTLEKALGMTIAPSSIYPVYDYIHESLGEQFIFYAEVVDMAPTLSKKAMKWISLSKLSKFKMSEQTRHDIIIGERVIKSRMTPSLPRQYPHL